MKVNDPVASTAAVMGQPGGQYGGDGWQGKRSPDVGCQAPALPPAMLTDEEAEEIRKMIAQGRRGPILLRWVEQLLQDRDERRQRERERDSESPEP